MAKDFLFTPMTPELYCSDIKASLDFYTRVLGFKIRYERPEEGFALLERQGSQLMLDHYDLANTSDPWIAGPLEKPFGRGVNFQIETTLVDELYETVLSSGAMVFLTLHEEWYRADANELGNRQFIVLDPDGYMLRFFQDLGERPGD